MIDLRSDTVTRPTAAMRRAISEAPVGDDVFGDDPTVIALEERVAELAGKEAALFVPSGTMGNFLGLAATASPGDEVILDRQCHIMNYEVSSVAVLHGLQLNALDGERGALRAEMIEPHIKVESLHTPGTRIIAMENTHNRAGGCIYPFEEMKRVRELASARGISVHLDGARLWNAHAATGVSIADYAACADTVSMCFSKGLGAPVGSILVSRADVIARARRLRKRLGGGMRQAGILAAGALYALEHHVTRLRDDHDNAKRLESYIRRVPAFSLDFPVETNIVVFRVDAKAWTVEDLLARLREHDVLAVAFGAGRVRMVTHLDVSAADVDHAGEALLEIAGR
ncbi:MAG: aminotransferase class I/II-fold pyridoxal phosphate-dependent enzyme [Candidatus Krumholzibacteria bacterium]|nr:aminotransferase class I/II-fold pyridoxal phosphate-dependent enzyme [Candidatus Krumholzibacteria bacterium]MDH4337708.1 aminotransferase class I/II-fold pyridoxal phosphate-dependent enzyme [Candidatus Krumholzibacteria bacterium]MDH5269853.1 aminotransferase class I/II-fold pyridoxal phosphate-dependent enzyme [Candidatus Krumholzibacteria bacterium]